MRVSELAKQYLKASLAEGMVDKTAYDEICDRDQNLMSKNELSQHNGALFMMSSALMAVIKNTTQFLLKLSLPKLTEETH